MVLAAEPLRQVMVLGIFGLALTFLFFSFQAPDVALSEIVVSGIAMPLIILATLRKISDQQRDRSEPGWRLRKRSRQLVWFRHAQHHSWRRDLFAVPQ